MMRLMGIEALEEAPARYGRHEVFKADQGSQFTGALVAASVRISMGGCGRWINNVSIERLWRSLNYEDADLKRRADGIEACAGIGT
jgi:putative transposase